MILFVDGRVLIFSRDRLWDGRRTRTSARTNGEVLLKTGAFGAFCASFQVKVFYIRRGRGRVWQEMNVRVVRRIFRVDGGDALVVVVVMVFGPTP